MTDLIDIGDILINVKDEVVSKPIQFISSQLLMLKDNIENGSEIIIFDTAGRTQIDLQMMSEIKQIEGIINPSETILVADSLTGQVAANVAKEFKNTVNLSSIKIKKYDTGLLNLIKKNFNKKNEHSFYL